MFDLQIEAEILGCDLLLEWMSPRRLRPTPSRRVRRSRTQLPAAGDGRLGMALDAMRHMKEKVEARRRSTASLRPLHPRLAPAGDGDLHDMFDDPDYVHRLLAYTTDVAAAMVGHYVEAGADVLAAVDPLVSQISPDHFQEFLAEPFRRIFAVIREADRASSFFVCGDATRNISVMCDTRPDGISIDENINMAEAKKVTDAKGVVIAGNIPLASVMLFGNQQDNMKVVIDELDAVDHANLIVSPGCDMPYDVPIENTIACEQAVHQTEQSRELVANYTQELPDIEVAIPDYTALERPMIEVFTIDSDTCAACYLYVPFRDGRQTDLR
jgi:uroporphyrinogen decarboxylase